MISPFHAYLFLMRTTRPLERLKGGWRIREALLRLEPRTWPELVVEHEGMRWRIWYPQDHVSQAFVRSQTYEAAATAFVRTHVRPGFTCVDVGANAGYYTVLMSRLVGSTGRVLAMEPAPDFLARLRAHVELNELTNVAILPVGIGDRDGEWSLNVAGCTATMVDGIVVRREPPMDRPEAERAILAARVLKVPILRLDEALERAGIREIDFLKIDVDGFEQQVLSGAEQTFSRRRPIILLEYFHRVRNSAPRTIDDVMGPIAGLGYTFQRDDRPGVLRTVAELRDSLADLQGHCNILCIPT